MCVCGEEERSRGKDMCVCVCVERRREARAQFMWAGQGGVEKRRLGRDNVG